MRSGNYAKAFVLAQLKDGDWMTINEICISGLSEDYIRSTVRDLLRAGKLERRLDPKQTRLVPQYRIRGEDA